MKVIRGTHGLTNNAETSERFFLAAPEINSADTEFTNRYGIDICKCKRDYYHQLLNVINRSITENTKELFSTLDSYNVKLKNNGDYTKNLTTTTILLKEAEKHVLNKKNEG